MKMLKRMLVVLLVLICLYQALLLIVYAIPNESIAGHVSSAIGVLEAEGPYPHYFFGYPFGQADNSTDHRMYQNLLSPKGATILQASMVPNYPRYWHGYAVFLRPLSLFLSIDNIRYLNMAVVALLVCLCFLWTAEKINVPAAIAFLLGLLSTFLWLAPFNLQYFTATTLTLLFSLLVLSAYGQKRFMNNIPVFFLVFGSLTHFFDFLTFPILTLGYPLILVLMLRTQGLQKRTFRSECMLMLACVASWCAGYGLTMLAKGLLGSLLLGMDVMGDIIQNATFRMDGSLPDGYQADTSLWLSLSYNLKAFFNPRNLGMFAIAAFCSAILAIRKAHTKQNWCTALPILGISLFPYVWYSVLQNHSIMHSYFTSKAQAITFFAVCAYFIAVSGFPKGLSRPKP